MARDADALVLELLAWLASGSRTYAEAMEAWQTHCPRHPVWEDALGAGLVRVVRRNGSSIVALTAEGKSLVAQR